MRCDRCTRVIEGARRLAAEGAERHRRDRRFVGPRSLVHSSTGYMYNKSTMGVSGTAFMVVSFTADASHDMPNTNADWLPAYF